MQLCKRGTREASRPRAERRGARGAQEACDATITHIYIGEIVRRSPMRSPEPVRCEQCDRGRSETESPLALRGVLAVGRGMVGLGGVPNGAQPSIITAFSLPLLSFVSRVSLPPRSLWWVDLWCVLARDFIFSQDYGLVSIVASSGGALRAARHGRGGLRLRAGLPQSTPRRARRRARSPPARRL